MNEIKYKLAKFIALYRIFGTKLFFRLLLSRFQLHNDQDLFAKKIEQYFFPKSSDDSKTQVLFLIPWMVYGGSDKVNLDILSHINKDKFSIHFITDVKVPHVWDYRFRVYTNNIYHLNEFLPPSLYHLFIINYIKVFKINTLLVSNSTVGYEVLPEIREIFKDIKVLDLLHGEGGKLESGGFPKFSAPYDKYIDTRIVINEYLKNHIITNYNVDSSKTKVIYNGIDVDGYIAKVTEKDKYRKLYHFSLDDVVVCFIGRLSYEKHPEKIVEVANNLVNIQNEKNVRFIIGGDGDMRAELENKINQLHLNDYVKLLGYVDDTANLFSSSDVSLILSEMEGLPIAILESMSQKVPVIATKVGGIPEMIDSGVNGFLVDYNEEKEMVSKYSELIVQLKETSFRRQLGEQAFAKVNNRFSINSMISEYETVLDPTLTSVD